MTGVDRCWQVSEEILFITAVIPIIPTTDFNSIRRNRNLCGVIHLVVCISPTLRSSTFLTVTWNHLKQFVILVVLWSGNDLLRDRLHWLRVPQRITFKCCLHVYKSLHGLAPAYIASSCIKKSTIQHRSGLRSASRDDLVIQATKSKFREFLLQWADLEYTAGVS